MRNRDDDPDDRRLTELARYSGLIIAVGVLVVAITWDFHWWGTFN